MEKKILILEDQEDIRGMYADSLADLPDVYLTQCGNGDTALKYLNAGGIDLVITDNQHPGLSGRELIDKMRVSPNLAKIPVILITECDNDQELRKKFPNATECLAKPIDISILHSQVAKMLQIKVRKEHIEPQDVTIDSHLQDIEGEDVQSIASTKRNGISGVIASFLYFAILLFVLVTAALLIKKLILYAWS
jgi:response regulator RpfG family c-di-GMP phosphodiesterase